MKARALFLRSVGAPDRVSKFDYVRATVNVNLFAGLSVDVGA